MKLVKRHRGGAALLVLSLVLPRLLVPMGYMPGTDAAGRAAIVLCDAAARAAFACHPQPHAHDGTPWHGAHDHAAHDQGAPGSGHEGDAPGPDGHHYSGFFVDQLFARLQPPGGTQ